MPTRKLTPPPPQKKAPTRKVDWDVLLRLAIARATTAKDPRLEGLRAALGRGQAERHLRGLGIVHEGDLDREFPAPQKTS